MLHLMICLSPQTPSDHWSFYDLHRFASFSMLNSWNHIVCSFLQLTSFPSGFPGGAGSKESACQCRKCKSHGFDAWDQRSTGEGHSNPLQYACLENSMGREAWWATVHRVARTLGSQKPFYLAIYHRVAKTLLEDSWGSLGLQGDPTSPS